MQLSDKQTSKVLKIIMVSAVSGALPMLIFKNGFFLAYLLKLGLSGSEVMYYLSLLPLIMFGLTIPFAFVSDAVGKKKVGYTGIIITFVGFVLLTATGSVSKINLSGILILGIIVFSIGMALLSSSWFALLQPVVPISVRGRFFGKQRLLIHVLSIAFTALVTYMVQRSPTIKTYQAILAVCTLSIIFRYIFYWFIPEIEKIKTHKIKILLPLKQVFTTKGYVAFCSYAFILNIATGACPWILGLLEKDVLNFTEDQIILFGNILVIGMVSGFYVCGKMIDRIGTHIVFICSHFAFGIVLFLFLLRDFLPGYGNYYLGILTLCYGFLQAGAGLAITSEMLSLIPGENKSISTAFCTSCWILGISLSGIISGKIIDIKLFPDRWQYHQQVFSEYDFLLLGCSLLLLISVPALKLIPSVSKIQWYQS